MTKPYLLRSHSTLMLFIAEFVELQVARFRLRVDEYIQIRLVCVEKSRFVPNM